MLIVRFLSPGADRPSVGVRAADTVTELPVAGLGELLGLPLTELRAALATTGAVHDAADVRLLPPVDQRMEVWAAGVTYQRSREARITESERSADVYDLVYDAERPELFFKSSAWRVTGDGESVSVRTDSEIDVPEPELGLVVNAHAEIVGYTVVNDMSSRSIEGVNPLYLPQAKIYLGGCAVGPGIRPVWEVADPYALAIELVIHRDGEVVWSGETSTSLLRRKFDELTGYLFRADVFPDGVVLATGTALVPDLPFTLAAGDRVAITVGEVGTLTSTVVSGKEGMSWLADSR
ncbi:fumarylacetoacetate hydrolase family protein [Actinophytocola algeriensis]|uniref:2-dehydro-3-deoxy-D-arabinonate dehydratase n=1 Tax=Actinophytocola algeriensis TaxID=1768010 RepID=A0A7W7VF54_9PSEU|nr:fumarylacetoacetate hydrolase family protein [Actinophytocola algeriensis]MBB4907978.1 2-dehydro-3-deoxy-D-arabinonate dehydratase [Actinophytocola algeriensis]MBE1480008.1 2-dehydro-3-deoxy-D-arabinonate dehydratase [Actinophytocola algeriensis]